MKTAKIGAETHQNAFYNEGGRRARGAHQAVDALRDCERMEGMGYDKKDL